MLRSRTSIALLLALGFAARAQSGDFPGPSLTGELQVELGADAFPGRDEEQVGASVAFAQLELQLAPRWFLDADLVLEPTGDEDPERTALFPEHDAYLETLALRLRHERFTLRLGKLTPRFGIAWDRAAGIGGGDLAEDYELSERWGLEGGVRFEAGRFGSHWLGASAFTMDASALWRSLLGDRDRMRVSDGGPGNTGRPNSFAVTLEGDVGERMAGLRYHAGFVQQGWSRAEVRHERAVALALELPLALPAARIDGNLLFEHVRVSGPGGSPGSARYTTGSLELRHGGWHGALVFAARAVGGGEATRDRFVELSLGRRLAGGTDVALGWRVAHGSSASSRIGLRIRRGFRF